MRDGRRAREALLLDVSPRVGRGAKRRSRRRDSTTHFASVSRARASDTSAGGLLSLSTLVTAAAAVAVAAAMATTSLLRGTAGRWR